MRGNRRQLVIGQARDISVLWTDWALIENEINKKKRFISVRDLTARANKALLELNVFSSAFEESPLQRYRRRAQTPRNNVP